MAIDEAMVAEMPQLKPVKTKASPAKGARNDKVIPVSPTGRVFLHPSFYNMIGCVLEFEQRMDLQRLRDILGCTLCRHPRFRSKVVFKDRISAPAATWLPVDLDITQHIVEVQLGEEDMAHPGTCIEKHLAAFISNPDLDPSRPLWAVHLIHAPRPKSVSSAVFFIHHALGDGTSLMSLLLASARQTQNPQLLPTLPGDKARKGRSNAPPSSSTSAAVMSVESVSPPSGAKAKEEKEEGQEGEETRSGSNTGGENAGWQEGAKGHFPTAESCETLDVMAASAGKTLESVLHPHREEEGDEGARGGAERKENGEAKEGEDTKGAEKRSDTLSTEKGRGSSSQGLSKGARILALVKNSVVEICRFNAAVLLLSDTRTPIRAFSKQHFRQRVCAVSQDISLSHLSQIRRAVGTTINDVMMAVMALAMERYLLHLQEQHGAASAAHGKGKRSQRFPRRPRVTAVGLVNLRKSPGLQELSTLMETNDASSSLPKGSAPWGNKLGLYLLPLPVRLEQETVFKDRTSDTAKDGSSGDLFQGSMPLESHSLQVLGKMKQMCDKKKLSLEAPYSYITGRAAMALSGTPGAAFLLRRVLSQTTLTVSNMLGPMEQVSLGGVPITAISPTAPPPQHALCCHFQSYNGTMKIVLCASEENYPDIDVLCTSFIDVFNELHTEATK